MQGARSMNDTANGVFVLHTTELDSITSTLDRLPGIIPEYRGRNKC